MSAKVKKENAETSAPAPEQSVIAYKAFDADMSCRGFKFEIGKTYEHEGTVSICKSGFHACALPFDCWRYYTESMTFAKVKLEGVSSEKHEDSKLVAAKITIEASLNISEWVKAQVAAVLDLCKTTVDALTSSDKESAATAGEGAHAATAG